MSKNKDAAVLSGLRFTREEHGSVPHEAQD